MRRIVHLVAEAARGGCETNCAVFIRHAPGFGHRVLVLGEPGPMTAVWTELGAEVIHLEILERGRAAFGRALARAGEAPADGIISWAGIRVPLQVWTLRRTGAPFIYYAGNPFSASGRIRVLLWLARYLMPPPPRTSVVACSSHVARSFLDAPYFKSLPIIRLLNPVDAPDQCTHHARTLGSDDVIRLGMVARLDPIKNHALLLRSFGPLRSRWPRVELHLAGDGVLRADLEALARELGIMDSVRFHGSVGDVPAFLDSLDLFCYLTTESEGMGSAFAEALARGLPCVANDLPVLREVAGEAENSAAAFVASTPEAVCAGVDSLLGDRAERERLSVAARRRAREVFAPDKIVQGYLAVLNLPP